CMKGFRDEGRIVFPPGAGGQVDDLFAAGVGDTAATLDTIRRYDSEHGYLMDP
ncbi:MAG: threonine synthase, partial [Gammaproteobacteria bacterium]|nr:threonine synthase [Gemmatimonadota bacterium]NIR36518.1 threonine synthase [Actinomycetota bacterium]NIU77163.1 threonine synthase [Gammaproteobacteria bacterium]